MSGLHICNAIQQSLGVKGVGSSVQILNNALEGRKLKIPTVAGRGGEEIRKFGDFAGEYGRDLKQGQLYEFCRQVWEGRIIIWMGKYNE